MMFQLVVLLIQTSIVLLVGSGTAWVLRSKPSCVVTVLRLTLFAVIGLALLSPLKLGGARPMVRMSEPPVLSQQIALSTPPVTNKPVTSPAVAAPQGVVARSESGSSSLPVSALLLCLWGVGTVAALVKLAFGGLVVNRIRRSSLKVTDLPSSQDVYESDDVSIPFVAHLVRPRIYLPSSWRSWSTEAVDAILKHESAHISNGDLRWRFALALVKAALWPQALLWVLGRQLESAEESLADQEVVAAGVRPTSYATILLGLRMSRKVTGTPSLAIGAVSNRSKLSQRVDLLLNPPPHAHVRIRGASLVLASVCGLGLTTMTAFAFGQNLVQTQSQTVQKSEDVLPASGRRDQRHFPTPADTIRVPASGIAQLRDGIRMSIEYVQSEELPSYTAWTPSGGPVTEATRRDVIDMKGSHTSNQGRRMIFVHLKMEGAKDHECQFEVEAMNPSERSVWQTYGDAHDRSANLASFFAPSDLKKTDLKVLIGAGRYRTERKLRLAEPDSLVTASKSNVAGPVGADISNWQEFRLKFPRELEGKDVMLAAFTKSRTPLPVATYQTETEKGYRFYTFDNRSGENIDYFEIQVRDYQTVIFQGISLYPDQRP
jgi:beta-lactamase regulating signal transducer with metallopeptidase domain